MRAFLSSLLIWFEVFVLLYFVVINSLYMWFSAFAYIALVRYRRRWTPRELGTVMRSPATPAVSIVVPAYNEEAGIVATVRSLLTLNYPLFEVIVIDDGSSDRTLDTLQEAFGLVRAPGSYEPSLATAPVEGVYRSLTIREVVAIRKQNGGKADAINAGINAAQHELVCVIDADSVMEEHALARAVLPFIEDPTTIAAGGSVRIGNGCVIDHGRVTDVRVPASWLARFQIVEYLRAFLAARVTHSAFNALLIVSGAFGLFRRDIAIAAGGFSTETIGEDMELIVRLHRFCRDQKRPYRIAFQPDPVVWTEAPESLDILGRQRNRWQRGTVQVLVAHRGMMGNPRYGRIGLLALPYYAIFETVGPVIELAGLLATIGGLALGAIDWRMAQLLFLAAILYGTLISVAAVLLEELSFRRYLRLPDVARLLAAALLENFGYRQINTLWRLQGVLDYLRGRSGWGAMTRKGLSTA
jgi:cellulose synthase/poly-beta-1,6-N-acetylglucosamine synthase-like glycosyltransferase